ncbi:uncharacterized protein LOC125042770 [Penaeus chinensis]|uniref:uncharacterized protein LOC125042770 n=1 Tax=Penaeus chinensis TaxID=139456 RepID=UPI001FB605EA|nr:uncharacterized protein LOC125042770 [Penaeus chinensis]
MQNQARSRYCCARNVLKPAGCGCGRALVRALWAGVLGSVSAIYVVGLAFQTSTYISYYCEEECTMRQWTDPHSMTSNDIVTYLRDHVIEPPQEEVVQPPKPQELENPAWRRMGAWDRVQDAILNLCRGIRNGVFVEVGAGGGLLLSLTAWLENRRAWKGLLLEPHPDAYASLRKTRKAAAAQVCVSDMNHCKQEWLWTPRTPLDMPPLFKEAARAKSTLLQYVADEDLDAGTLTPVQCFPLQTLVWAALGRRARVDLMVIHTMGGEYKILNTLTYMDMLILMLVVKISTEVEKKFVEESAQMLGFVPYTNVPPEAKDFLFFVNKKVDLVQGKV